MGTGSKTPDITDAVAVLTAMKTYRPDAVIHCAAYTAVDRAEEEPERAFAVNETGTRNVAAACAATGAKLVYLSTDYVFDGTKEGKYVPEDPTNPKSVYGKTKYLGELEALKVLKHYIVRISWVFGINGHNFIKTMLKLAETHDAVSVVSDQVGSPTYTVDLARLLVDMAHADRYGIYHATNEGECSWADFAEYIFFGFGQSFVQVLFFVFAEKAKNIISPIPIGLIKYGILNDPTNFRKAAEALCAEERAKQHTILANKIEDLLKISHRPVCYPRIPL